MGRVKSIKPLKILQCIFIVEEIFIHGVINYLIHRSFILNHLDIILEPYSGRLFNTIPTSEKQNRIAEIDSL